MPEAACELILAAFRSVRPGQDSWLGLGQQCVELLGLVQRCAEAIDVADVLLAHLDDDESAVRVEIAVARALWLSGQWQASVDRSSRALARPGVSAALRARLAAVRALAVSRVEPAADAGPIAADALREADRLDDDAARLLAWHALAEVARNRADHEGSLRHYRALRAASGPAYVAQEIQGLQHLDRFHDAAVMLREARRDTGLDKGMTFLSLIYSQIWWDYNLGRLDEAGAGAATLLSLALERGSYTCGIDAASLLSLVALQRGDVAGARQSLTRGFGAACRRTSAVCPRFCWSGAGSPRPRVTSARPSACCRRWCSRAVRNGTRGRGRPAGCGCSPSSGCGLEQTLSPRKSSRWPRPGLGGTPACRAWRGPPCSFAA